MTMTADELPDALRGRPFTVAEALDHGVSESRLRQADLASPAWGVRTESVPETHTERCRAVWTAMGDVAAFSHVTAARLLGLPLSAEMEADDNIHVIRTLAGGRCSRRGVIGHRGLENRAVVYVEGLPVVSPADTWVDLGELIGPGKPVGLDDLIVVGDAVAQRVGSVNPLRETLDLRNRPRGKLTLLEALELVRVGSESPGETRTRLVLVRAGLPEPELNLPVLGFWGQWLGRPDMRWTARRVLLEYQGREFHDSDEQRAKDEIRFKGFTDDDWSVVEVWDVDVNTDEARHELVLRVADDLGVPRDLLKLGECHPRFFSTRMLELAEIRARRAKATKPR